MSTATVKTPTPQLPVQSSNDSQPQVPLSPSPIVEKYKVKVNGKDIEVSLDELKRAYGLDKASRQRFEDAAQKIKDAENLKNMYSSKDWNNLLRAGWSEEELEEKASEFIINRARRQNMTPEQLKQLDREEEYHRLKQKESQDLENQKLKSKRELEEREAKLYQTAFFTDLTKADKQTWLDLNDPIILQHIIKDITDSLLKHEYDMPVMEAVKRLEEQLENKGATKKDYLKKLLKKNIKELDDNDLEAFLEKGVKGIREKSVEAVKRAEAPFTKDNNVSYAQGLKNAANQAAIKHDAKRYRDLRYKRI